MFKRPSFTSSTMEPQASATRIPSRNGETVPGTFARTALFDRDTIPGAEPEELMALKLPALILPGHTEFHATSCARYLEECIPGSEYWDVHLESQPLDLVRDHILAFFAAHASAGVR